MLALVDDRERTDAFSQGDRLEPAHGSALRVDVLLPGAGV
jgi:hypothetical protein